MPGLMSRAAAETRAENHKPELNVALQNKNYGLLLEVQQVLSGGEVEILENQSFRRPGGGSLSPAKTAKENFFLA